VLLTTELAAASIADGQLIAYPTESVYGIGCDPNNLTAVKAVLELKARDANKGFIVIAASLEQLHPFIEPPTNAELETLNQAWPGPVTFVVKAKAGLDPLLTGKRDTLAVRVSAHPVVTELCNACGSALISTSANLSGEATLNTADEIIDRFGDQIAGVVKGELGALDKPTSIFSLATGRQLR